MIAKMLCVVDYSYWQFNHFNVGLKRSKDVFILLLFSLGGHSDKQVNTCENKGFEIYPRHILNNPNTIKSYKNYVQNTQHMVLPNRPTLIIGTERLACLNSPPGVQQGTLAYHAAGPGFEPRARPARRVCFFSPPSLPSGDSFFRTFPTNPAKVLGLRCKIHPKQGFCGILSQIWPPE